MCSFIAVRHGMDYAELGASAYEQRYKMRVINGLQRRARTFGFFLQPVQDVPQMAVS